MSNDATYDLVIRAAKAVLPEGVDAAEIGISNGRIVRVARGQERLDVLERGVQVRGGRAAHLQPEVRGGELARDALDEEARLGARDGVGGGDA